MIYIIGIGPGNDIDYLTLKAYKAIQNVDLGIYLGEMIGVDIKNLFLGKELITGRNIDKAKVKSIINIASCNKKEVALLMPGDISMFSGQFNEQFTVYEFIQLFERCNYEYEIVAGVGAMNALCAKSKIDLTAFTNSQNVFTTSIERLMDTGQFNQDKLRIILSANPNLVLYQSYREWPLIKQLLEENYNPNSRIIFAYKISWQDEIIIKTTLENADNDIRGMELNKHTIILIIPDK